MIDNYCATTAPVAAAITAPVFRHKCMWSGWGEVWFLPSGYEGPWCGHGPFDWASQPSRLPLTNEWYTRDRWCAPEEAPLRYSHTGRTPAGVR
jgi:hypothetical protein